MAKTSLRIEKSLPQIVGKGYGRFFRCKKRYRVLKGGKGSKKSSTTALNFIYRIMKHKESNLLVVRAVYNTHKDSTFAQLKWAQEKLGVSHLWQNNLTPLEMVYKPTGQKILFRGFDDVLKIASTTVSKGYLCWVWIEEAFEIEREEDFLKLDLSLPRGKIPSSLFKQTTLTFNPWSEKHWLKERFFDKEDDTVATFTTDYRTNEFLDETDILLFKKMERDNPQRYLVAGLGHWGHEEGLIFENWCVEEFDARNLGIITNEQGEREDRSWQFNAFFGLDYGYTNDPTAFIAFKANPIEKKLYIFDEHYGKRMLNSDIAKMIKEKGFQKEKIRADAAEPKSNDDLRRMGITRIQASRKGPDSVKNGIMALKEYRIIVHPKCKNTIYELSNYLYKKDSNEPEDRNNHLMDALRYGFYDVRFFKPVQEENKKIIYDFSPEDMKGEWF